MRKSWPRLVCQQSPYVRPPGRWRGRWLPSVGTSSFPRRLPTTRHLSAELPFISATAPHHRVTANHLKLLGGDPGVEQVGEVCVKPIGQPETAADKGSGVDQGRGFIYQLSGQIGQLSDPWGGVNLHCDVSGSTHQHRVGDEGYAGSLQDRRVFILVLVNCIEVRHLWPSASEWDCRVVLS